MTTSQSPCPHDHVNRRAIARNHTGVLGAAGFLVVGSAGALLAAFAGGASAASTILVDSNGDGAAAAANCTDGTVGNCTLRDAAAAASAGDTINFAAGISTITLTAGTVDLNAVNIIGPGSADLTITTAGAPGAYRSLNFPVGPGGIGDVLISGVTITKNGINARHEGDLTLDDVTITGAATVNGGAALYSGDDVNLLTITNSHFDDNEAAGPGGHIYVYNGGSATISGSTFTNGTAGGAGGAIFVTSYTKYFTMVDCTVTGNTSLNDAGGGLKLNNQKATAITRTTVSNNTAATGGGGLDIGYDGGIGSPLLIDSSTISGNSAVDDGGGLYARYVEGFTMRNSTVSGNSSHDGAGLELNYIGDSLIANSTIADNTGDTNSGAGGAMYLLSLNGDVEILFTTISGNSSANSTVQIGGYNGHTMDVTGTIITDNSTASGTGTQATDILYVNNYFSGLLTLTNSLIMGTVTTPGSVDGGGNLLGVSAQLESLADNGGPTRTMAPLTGSPVIDAGPLTWTAFTGDGFDQRATPWLRVDGTRADIGAYEVQAAPEPTTTISPDPTSTVGVESVVPAFTG